MPFFISVETFHIYDILLVAIVDQSTHNVFVAALNLVLLNSIRAIPHYVGAFFVAESFIISDDFKYVKMVEPAIVCFIIPPVYFLIGIIHNVQYDLGLPAFTLVFLLTLLGKNGYKFISNWKKVMLIIVFLTAFQILDIIPAMSGLPIGRGDTSIDVKLASEFLEVSTTLNGIGVLCFFLLFTMGLLLFLLIHDENKLRMMSEVKNQQERLLMDTRLRVLENRTYFEVRHLVHDLKSPLTSAQVLVGLVRISSENDHRVKDAEYLSKVETSIEKMSNMVSEILHGKQVSFVATEEIFDSVLAQISVSEYSNIIIAENFAPHIRVSVNKIRFIRALINLIENSFYALQNSTSPVISLSAASVITENNEEIVQFVILDNGNGIDPEILALIWERGYSTRNSHGLGLAFVKTVVSDCDGTIDIESGNGFGTKVTIKLPKEV